MATAEVGVDLVTKLKDKGFKDLEKSSKKQSSALAVLGKRLAAAFSVAAVLNFGKQSVKAFQDAQKEANRLRTQLQSLNLGFAQPFLTDFIQKTQLATGISGGVLTDAFNTLSQATNDVTTAQRLLNVSLDISAATGRDLSSVTTALQRGYAGQVSALSRLKIGFTTANLKGRDFNDVLLELENKFKGSSARAADTLEGKIARLNEAVDEAKEAFGEGLVKGIEDSGVAVEDLQKDIISLGEALGTVSGQLTGFFASVNRDILTYFETDPGFVAAFVRSLVKSQGDIVRAAEERGRTELRTRLKILEAERKAAREKAAADAKAAALKKRTAEIDRLRNAIQFKFDIDAINLQAALRRKLSDSDRDRALQLSALKISDFQTDEEAIKTLQAATQGRYDDAMNLEKMLQLLTAAGFATSKAAIESLAALKPEINFKDNLESVIARLKALIEGKYIINIGASISVPDVPAPGKTATATPGGGTFTPGGYIDVGDEIAGTGRGTSIGGFDPTPATTSAGISAAITGIIANQNALTTNFLASLPSGLSANSLATARYELQARQIQAQNQLTNYLSGARYQMMANEVTGQNTMTNQLAADRYTAMQNFYTGRGSEPVVVNVNVQGSVVAQNDLVAAVTDAVYATQRVGNSLLLTDQ